MKLYMNSYYCFSLFFFSGLFPETTGYIHLLKRMFSKRPPEPTLLEYPKLDFQELTPQDKYDLQWYVIGEQTDFTTDKPYKATIWNKHYVVWKNADGNYTALDDACSHKGASLSKGKICDNRVVCPYHGYEFDENGTLLKIPGISFRPSTIYNVPKYAVVEKNGWVYLNTYLFSPVEDRNTFQENIYVEEGELTRNDSCVYLNMHFECYSRILSENSLDVMHIGFVHTFGNTDRPNPVEVHPPKQVGKNHYKTTYLYEAGEQSFARKMFGVKDLVIENEFVLPHTTVARVVFGNSVSTVITFALPINENQSKLFVKTYRNFWPNSLGDLMTKNMMLNTMYQDKIVVENIDVRYLEGKFNMKYDKLQNVYKTFYKKLVHRLTD